MQLPALEFRVKGIRDEATRMEYALREAAAEGRQEGREAALVETARKMRDQGVPAETVWTAAGMVGAGAGVAVEPGLVLALIRGCSRL